MATTDLTAETFMTTVEGTGIVLVDWWAAWCGPCRMFAPVFEQASEDHPDIVFGSARSGVSRWDRRTRQTTQVGPDMSARGPNGEAYNRNVRTMPLARAYRESRVFRDLRDADTLRGRCGRCEFRASCGGSRGACSRSSSTARSRCGRSGSSTSSATAASR